MRPLSRACKLDSADRPLDGSLPAPSSATASSTALTADAPAPSLSAIYTSPSAVAAPSFKAPTPPGAKYR